MILYKIDSMKSFAISLRIIRNNHNIESSSMESYLIRMEFQMNVKHLAVQLSGNRVPACSLKMRFLQIIV